MRRFSFLVPALLVVIPDQITKIWCVKHLSENSPVPFVDHLLFLTLTFNTRGAFSLFSFPSSIFVAITIALLAVVFYYALTLPFSFKTQTIIGLLAGGGIGNLIDRLRIGHVVDFLDLRWWPVFNVADSAITISMTIIIVYILFHPSWKGNN